MRQISINRLKEGDILGRTIYSSQGRVLLGRGVALTLPYLQRLDALGISIVYIDDPLTKDIIIDDVITEEHRREALFSIENSSDNVRVGRDFSGFEVKKAVNNIVEDILFQREILLSLMDIRSYDNQMFAHAVSVCILATVMGKAMGLDREKLDALAMGALLHDIGTVKIPKFLLSKREPFNAIEMETFQAHTLHGFNILREKRDIHLLSAHVAFQHHELINGSGYPRKLTGDDIHLLAKIVGIADFYDNLINDGPGHSRTLPHEACEIIMGCAGKFFPLDLIILFLKHVAAYPTGSTVRLSTGETGIVVDQNKSLPMRPIVRVLTGAIDLEHARAIEYNLVEEKTIFIEGILD